MTATVALGVALALTIVLLAWVLWRAEGERRTYLEHLQAQREEAREERRSLADRIQHPERVQVQPNPDYVPPEPPRDLAELAYVGGIVPEFVHVGHPPGTLPGEGPPEEV